MTTDAVDLRHLSSLTPLYRKMRAGTHIGRLNEPDLWANLEANHEDYARLFSALGYQLGMDPRGFAWLDEEREAVADESRLTKKVRGLALLISALLDFQANAGRSLPSFMSWEIDDQLLSQVLDTQREALAMSEMSSVDEMRSQLGTAVTWGMALNVEGHWRLLPAVARIIDKFPEAAAQIEASVGLEHEEDEE